MFKFWVWSTKLNVPNSECTKFFPDKLRRLGVSRVRAPFGDLERCSDDGNLSFQFTWDKSKYFKSPYCTRDNFYVDFINIRLSHSKATFGIGVIWVSLSVFFRYSTVSASVGAPWRQVQNKTYVFKSIAVVKRDTRHSLPETIQPHLNGVVFNSSSLCSSLLTPTVGRAWHTSGFMALRPRY